MERAKLIIIRLINRTVIKQTIGLLFFLIWPAAVITAQEKVCRHDTVNISVGEYRGQVLWQSSSNGKDWNYVQQEGADSISLVALDPFFVRLEILDGNCNPYYSDIFSIEIHDQPLAEFDLKDSVCINERDFIISGGQPEGGEYFGPGVTDGRFIPSEAGIGIHTLGYLFRDPETNCADTAYSSIEVLALTSPADAGADMELIMADTVQLQANTPETGIGTWTVSSGLGGSFSDQHDPNAWFRKDSAQLDYTLTWTIEGPCGYDADEVSLNFMELSINPCPGTPIVTDSEGNTYKTVLIGDQCWMAENLNTGTFVASTATSSNHSDLKNNGVIEKYCFENDEANCGVYGGLYDWHEAMGYTEEEGVRGICPEGWHLPTNLDWAELDSQFKYGDAGEHLKETGDAGYGGLFAGDRHQRGEFYSQGSSGFWWSSTSYVYLDVNEGYFRKICACNGWLEKDHFHKMTGLSVRCIKDE